MCVYRDLHGHAPGKTLSAVMNYHPISSSKNNTDGTNVAQGSLIMPEQQEHA